MRFAPKAAVSTTLCMLLLSLPHISIGTASAAASASWTSPPTALTSPAVDASSHQIAISADGTKATAIWYRNTGSSARVESASAIISDTTVTWSSPNLIASLAGYENPSISLALTPDGLHAIALFKAYDGGAQERIKAATATISGSTAAWTAATFISEAGRTATYQDVAISSDGTKATAVWSRSNGSQNVIQSASAVIDNTGATWSTPTNLSDATQSAYECQVALSSDGTRATVVWSRTNGANWLIQSSSATILDSAASWGSVSNLSLTGGDAFTPQIALSANGATAISVWYRQSAEQLVQSSSAAITNSSASWGAVSDLSATGGSAWDPQIAVSSDGSKATAVWTRNDGSNNIVQTSSASITSGAASWATAASISAAGGGANVPQLKLSADGTKATAVWARNNGSNGIVQSASATISSGAGAWSMPTDVSVIGFTSYNPLVALSDDGLKALAIWVTVDADWKYSVFTSTASISVSPDRVVPVQPFGYWKNAEISSPQIPASLGGYNVTTQSAARAVFKATNCGTKTSDAVGCLAGQLLVAKFNISAGALSSCINSTVSSADSFLRSTVNYTGPAAYSLSKTQRASALALTSTLTNYNINGCPTTS